VPDLAEIGIDIRSIPGLDYSRIQEHLKAELGDDISLEPIVDVGAVWTDPSSPWIRDVYGIVRDVTGEDAGSEPRTAPYFTDASALTPAFGNPPTIILGPQAKRRKLTRQMSIVLFNAFARRRISTRGLRQDGPEGPNRPHPPPWQLSIQPMKG
jgi:hypothetical protein